MENEFLGKPLAVRLDMIKTWREDSSASKRQIPVYISKENHIMVDVYRVPLDFPIYRLENIRTESDQQSFIARNPEIPKSFFNDPECREALKKQHDFLFKIANSGGERNHYELFQKEKFKVDEELILNSKGVLLNGNTRISALRELYHKDPGLYSHFISVPMAILPSTLTEENEKYIEISLQIEPERKKEYKWTSEALSVNKRRLSGDSLKQIAADFKRSSSSVGHPKRLLNQLLMADKYLKKINSEGDYELLLDNQFALDEIYKVWDKLKDNDKMCRWWLKLAHLELTESREGRSKGRDYENFKKWGRKFILDPVPMLETRGIVKNTPSPDNEKNNHTDDVWGGLDISENDQDDTPVYIPDPDEITIDDEKLVGALGEGADIVDEEEKRKANRNQLYDDVVNAIDNFESNINKIKDPSRDFDKIQETLDELSRLSNTIELFKQALLNKKPE